MLLGCILCVHLLVAWLSRGGAIRDDAESYVLLAQNLAAGHGYVFQPGEPPTSWRAPGYPVFLAGIFWLTNGSLVAARLINAFLWTLTALLVYALARKTVGPRPALLAAGITGFYPEFLGFSGLVWSENIFMPLFIGAIYACTFLGERKSLPFYVGTGLLIGVAILTRSTAVVLLPFLWFLAVKCGERPRAYLSAGAATLAALVVVGAWSARNYQLHDRFMLVESNTGYNLYVGHHPETPIPFAWKKLDTAKADPEYLSLIAGKTEGEKYDVLKDQAVQRIKENPLRAIALCFSKTFDFWLPDFFIARNIHAGAFGPVGFSFLWKIVLALTVGICLALYGGALAQAIRTRSSWHTQAFVLLMILYTLPHSVVYGASRYRLPLTPLLIILAAPFLLQLWNRRRNPDSEPSRPVEGVPVS